MLLVLSIATLLITCASSYDEISFNDLPYNEDGRLMGDWILFRESTTTPSASSLCSDEVLSDPNNWLQDFFSIAQLTARDLQLLINNEIDSAGVREAGQVGDCFFVRLIPGSPRHLIHHPLPHHKFETAEDSTKEQLFDWFLTFHNIETGWVSYLDNPLAIYWRSDAEERTQVASLLRGNANTVWLQTRMGHTFEIEDTVTGEVVFVNTALYDTYNVVGDIVLPDATEGSTEKVTDNKEDQIRDTLSLELERSQRVRRTFTRTGFDKGQLPRDLFASMLTYYYNSYNNTLVEEWSGLVHVNWWESVALIVTPPWNLKRYWQSRLMPMVERWIGGEVPLESTDIYGIRRYQDGARLLTHVDREETHAVSVIINLEQVGMREPWFVEIYDFYGHLHLINMEPGEIVYYESARCLHGRMAPLRGESYSNIFSHYRPVGDPAWFLKGNPAGTIEPYEYEQCGVGGDGESECGLPFIVPEEKRIVESQDLFNYWVKVGSA